MSEGFDTNRNQQNDLEEQQSVSPSDGGVEQVAPAENQKKKNVKKEVISWILTLLTAVVAALLIRTFLFEPIKVDGESMLDTLHDHELVFVTKPEYLISGPQRQDVVICRYPNRGNTYFVKRLIGLPGDTLVFTYKTDMLGLTGATSVMVNGEVLDESYLTPERNRKRYSSLNGLRNMEHVSITFSDDGNTATIVLGEDQYFVMGDNRDSSNDSRAQGPISRDAIIGHVRFVFFPFNAIRGIE